MYRVIGQDMIAHLHLIVEWAHSDDREKLAILDNALKNKLDIFYMRQILYLVEKEGLGKLVALYGKLEIAELKRSLEMAPDRDLSLALHNASSKHSLALLNLIQKARGSTAAVSLLMKSTKRARYNVYEAVGKNKIARIITSIQSKEISGMSFLVATQDFLALLPSTARTCYSCQEAYEDGLDEIMLTRCRQHSIHACHVSLQQSRNFIDRVVTCPCVKEPQISSFSELFEGFSDAPPFQQPTPDTEENRKGFPLPPAEIQALIVGHLDSETKVKAIQAGLDASPMAFAEARHSYVWSLLLPDTKLEAFKMATRECGNVFLIGYGLQYLYHGIYKLPEDTPSRLDIYLCYHSHHIRTWHTKEFYFKVQVQNTTIFIRTGSSRYGGTSVHGKGLGQYLWNDRGKIKTNLLDLYDTEFKLHTIDMSGSKGEDRYQLKLDNLRSHSCNSHNADSYLDGITFDFDQPSSSCARADFVPWDLWPDLEKLGSFIREQKLLGIKTSDADLQRQARVLLYGLDEELNPTAADNNTWLDSFKRVKYVVDDILSPAWIQKDLWW